MLVFTGGVIGLAVLVGYIADKIYQAGQTKRTIRDINYTRDQAINTMNNAHQRFREQVDRETRRYR